MSKIKKLRNMTGLSQSEFAKKYNISVRTLQQWEQNISNPLEIVINLIEKDIQYNSTLRHLYKNKSKNWKVCINNPFMNTNKIYPIQQRKVRELINDITKNNKDIKKIVIFGSSVNDKCHIGSDVDIYVESDSKQIKINEQHDFEYDLWTNYSVDERLKKEIEKKGVIVYE